MKILVCNDDGVYAPGLSILAAYLSSIATVTVIAPDRNQSAVSKSLTLTRPLRVKHLDNNFISVEGTPTDCVHLGITGLLDERPDMVVAGINEGANLGDDVLYSGTVAAATEGRFLGLPALAVSLVIKDPTQVLHYETAATVAKNLVLRLQSDPLPAQTILNVNVPNLPYDQLKGYAVVRLGQRHNAENIIASTDPRGQKVYWIGPAGAEADAGPGTDFQAVAEGYVAITPLLLDLTHYKSFSQLVAWTEGL
ncbi:5'/3'-nucleotidase SurE [soil metagenome]